MNALWQQLGSMKVRQGTWSIGRDVGQGLRMLETLPHSCYGPEVRSSSQLGHVYSCLWLAFVYMELTSNRWEDLIDMSVQCRKRLHFRQIGGFIVLSSFILALDVRTMID